ncbi:SRSF protein kinase 2 [Tolypocladium ophioglossoides CBS 100239]|uniref:non-specific serine/threonine protein kinase n=1 Tax=Tolypocladium ophioglossoides (strain CBS 100239) TaxID=1163406 RepID=A0A0L0N7K3_TOLOC|nr:SRSF protein kinase 2 [Tolypocladium ophioglossoides CBS 100239]
MEYENIEDVERLEDYRPGGYHPINIGDELHGRYQVVHKLGYGAYSTTWLARDQQLQRYVAVKVGTSDSNPQEIDVLSALTGTRQTPVGSPGKALILPLFDKFRIKGPNGVHPCHVTAPARSSLSGAKEGSYTRLFQLDVSRALAAQLAIAIAYTHAQGYVHGGESHCSALLRGTTFSPAHLDLHIGNVLFRLPLGLDHLSVEQIYKKYGKPDLESVVRLDGRSLPPSVPSHSITPIWLGEPSEEVTLTGAKILLADWGEAFAPSQHLRRESHTPLSIRPPEARFEPSTPLSFSSDIWTLACSIWAILGQKPLFDGFLATQDDITCEQVDALGILPPEWWQNWEARLNRFTEAGSPIKKRLIRSLEDRFETGVQRPRRREGMVSFELEERDAILAMLRSMLAFRPENRLTSNEVLKSEWMRKWAIPEYEKL